MSATLDDPDHSGSAGNGDGNSVSNKDLTLFTKLLEPKYTGDPDTLDISLDRIDDAEDRLAVLTPPVILGDPQAANNICWSCRKEGHSSFDPVCERFSKNKARADSSKSK